MADLQETVDEGTTVWTTAKRADMVSLIDFEDRLGKELESQIDGLKVGELSFDRQGNARLFTEDGDVLEFTSGGDLEMSEIVRDVSSGRGQGWVEYPVDSLSIAFDFGLQETRILVG